MTATWLANTLRTAGLTVEEAPRWTVRGGSQFTPKGVMVHHTLNHTSAGSVAGGAI